MQKNCNVVVTMDIPAHYQCSECGSRNIATLNVWARSYQAASIASKKEAYDTERIMRTNATRRVAATVERYYKEDPIKWAGELCGKCSACGHVEPWQISPKKKKNGELYR